MQKLGLRMDIGNSLKNFPTIGNIIKKQLSLIISIVILWIITGILLVISFKQNQGHIVYAIDDTYIHMAIAKNFAQDGVWGITKFGFSSSSSSILYTFLIAVIYFITGVNEITPFILNVIFATFTLLLVYIIIRRYELNSFWSFVVLLSIIFFTPLPALIFGGMEHTLHIILTISFVYLSVIILSKDKANFLEYSFLLVLAFFVTAARYEGLLLIFVVSILFVLKKKWLYPSFLLIAGVAPLVIYGIISIMKGWFFLPNSVLLKSNVLLYPGATRFLFHFFGQILQNPHIYVLVLVALLLLISQYKEQKSLWKDTTIMLIIFIATTLLHTFFARFGWFFRYEAYLVALGIVVVTINLKEYFLTRSSIHFDKSSLLKKVAIILVIIVIVFPLAQRGLNSLMITPQATNNIYDQQYQMGLFLKQYYFGENVAANDIGAVSYFGGVRLLDLEGLGSLEVAKTKINGIYNTKKINDLARQKEIKIALVYDRWYQKYGGLPSNWIKVGEWKIQNNVVTGGDTVSFYATSFEEENKLINNLAIFSSDMPKDIIQTGKYNISK